MPRIYISRARIFWKVGLDVELYLNDVKCDYLYHGENKYFELEPGKHKLRFKQSWLWSNEITVDLKENDNIYFEAIESTWGYFVSRSFFIFLFLYLMFSMFTDLFIDYFLVSMIGFAVAEFIGMIVLRKRFFRLLEIKPPAEIDINRLNNKDTVVRFDV